MRLTTYNRTALENMPVAGPDGLRALIRREVDARNLSITGTAIVTMGKADCIAALMEDTATQAEPFALSGAIAPNASTAPNADAAVQMLADAVRLLTVNRADTLDEAKVRELAHDETVKALGNGAFPSDRVQALIDAALANIPARKLEIVNDGRTVTVEGTRHKQFEDVLKAVTARRSAPVGKKGKTINVFLHGSPGGGKSHVAKQIADGLGAKFTSHVCSPADTASKVTGFLNKANGGFAEGIAYDWFKNGGLLFVDEFCNADPSFPISMNSLVENAYFTFPNGETVIGHDDRYLIVGDNTDGTGSKDGFTRRTLDASTRSRFYFIRFDYDEELELMLSGNQSWFTYVAKVRHIVQTTTSKAAYVTPRATYDGAALLAVGIPVAQVIDGAIFGPMGLSAAQRQTVLAAAGEYRP